MENESVASKELSVSDGNDAIDEEQSFAPSELYCIAEESSVIDDFEWTESEGNRSSILKSSALLIRSAKAEEARKAKQMVRFDIPVENDDEDDADSWNREKEKQKAVSGNAAKSDTVHWALWIMNNGICADESSIISAEGGERASSAPGSPSSDSTAANSSTPILNDVYSSDILFGWNAACSGDGIPLRRTTREPLLGIASRNLERSSSSFAYSEPAPQFLLDANHHERTTAILSQSVTSPVVSQASQNVVSEETYHDTDDIARRHAKQMVDTYYL